jgi:hypothetical protein
MNTVVIILGVFLVLAGFWISALYAEKKGLLKDEDNNFIPDVIEDKVDAIKTKAKNIKKAIKE